jgi:methylated-DNA-[protein]-cysteine S-methyltransferase
MNKQRYFTEFASPLGSLLLVSNGEALTGLYLDGLEECADDWKQDNGPFRAVREQLQAYFAGELIDFDLRLAAEGTDFQRKVWNALRRIPFGRTCSYADVARRVGNPRAMRAVGAANGRNRIAIVVPCHRVIAADGTLGGYGGGLDRKEWLLRHEREVLARKVG